MPGSRQLRVTHWSRYLEAIPMLVWLVFWIAGEAFGLWLMVLMAGSALSSAVGRPQWLLSWAPPTDGTVALVLVFLLFWLPFWTVAGVAAATHLLRRMSGEDDVEVTANALKLTWRAGPIRRRREIPLASIRRIRIASKAGAVVADTDSGTVTIADLGDVEERRALHAWLLSQVEPADEARAIRREREVPPASKDVDVQGAEILVTHPTRRARILRRRVMLIVAGLMSLGWLDVLRRGFINPTAVESLGALATLIVAASGLWLMTARTEWSLRQGRLSVRRRDAHWTWREHDFNASSTMAMEHSRDSDGDDRYALVIKDQSTRRVLERSLYEPYELLALGEWLSARTGLPFQR